jgi:hypothetical protein
MTGLSVSHAYVQCTGSSIDSHQSLAMIIANYMDASTRDPKIKNRDLEKRTDEINRKIKIN